MHFLRIPIYIPIRLAAIISSTTLIQYNSPSAERVY